MILSGSLCALATPFRSYDDAIDLEAFGRLIERQLDGGTRGVVAAGSTGEAAALDDMEFSTLLEFAVARVAGRVPVLAGTGMSATRKTVQQTLRARDAGVDAALVAAPAYVRPTQEGMYRHFSEIADRGGLPVVLYNVPSRTACDIEPATVQRLARHGNIVGIKEASTEPDRMSALLGLRSAGFVVLSGDDATAARAIRCGADGLISVAANIAAREIAQMCELAGSGDAQATAALLLRLTPLFEHLSAEPNPIPVKWCLAQVGIGDAHLRLPLVELSASHRAAGFDAMAALGLVEAAPAVG
ncbi:MAG: 4-hydroxy-tetrahydrodipicolinate synthase [Dokdonella sp.]|uniref:4-hydroxy-tetrahydrodipicolinate synthase n=1 Tax=Dokdonella sp. TaxID=2291710 RepID=UPI003265BD03